LETAQSNPSTHRIFELVAAGLLGLATIATAWCAYQAAAWNQQETDLGREASDIRAESTRLFSLGTQKTAYDATIAAMYAEAVSEQNTRLVEFYRENLVRPEFLPVIEQWEDQARNGQPLTKLIDDPAYLESQFGESQALATEADAKGDEGNQASENSASFVRTTIFLASALFFVGITSQFRARSVQLALLLIGTLMFGIGVSLIADLPATGGGL